MTRRRLTVVALSALGFAACAHGGGPRPVADGASLYRRNCGSCHRLMAPSEHDAATWRRAVDRFGARLAPEERAAVARHLGAE